MKNVVLVICTFKRPLAIKALLISISNCTYKPSLILVVDSSPNDDTEKIISSYGFNGLIIIYYNVPAEFRGLTNQRNFGINHLPEEAEIVAFLDDDIKVEPDYFEKLLETYEKQPDAIGVGGIDLNDNNYYKKEPDVKYSKYHYYELDGWVIIEPLRNKVRKVFGLMTNLQPGIIPEYSHGRSTLPPGSKTYEVEHFMGGIASYRRELLENVKFSKFFSGYGLYEDFDFCVRALKYGKLYVNTNAKVWHYHEPSGRPDFYKYGKMVVRNGWYVWRVRFPSPSLEARYKWHATTLLLAKIRLLNVITGPQRINALKDYLGRIYAWIGVIARPPVRSE